MRSLFSLSFIVITLALSPALRAQNAHIAKLPELERLMNAQTDTTYVFNFFATWCDPCVKEFPSFQKLSIERSGQKLKVIFVSLDFRKAFKSKLLPFLKKRHVTNDVLLLDEPDYNAWIDRIDTAWDGNLPMTLVINNARHQRHMYAHDFTLDSLRSTIEPFLQ